MCEIFSLLIYHVFFFFFGSLALTATLFILAQKADLAKERVEELHRALAKFS